MMTALSCRPSSLFESCSAAHVLQHLEAEGIVIVVFHQELARLFVVAFRMLPKYLSHICGQRAIDINRQRRNLLGVYQLVQVIDDVLSPSHGEGGDDQKATLADRLVYHCSQLLSHLGHGAVMLASVSRFRDEDVGTLQGLRIADHCSTFATDVSGEDERFDALFALGHLKGDRRRSEDMARIVKCQFDSREDCERSPVFDGLKQVHSCRSILSGVERLDGRQALPGIQLGHELRI